MGFYLDTQATRSTLMSVDTTLSANITAAQDYIPIASTTNFSTSVVAEIETTNEVVSFDSITTNRAQYSEDFTNAFWALDASGSWSANAGVAPDGTTTAEKYIPDVTSTPYHWFYHYWTTISNNTFSIYAKADGYDYISLIFYRGATSSSGVQFNLATGVVVTSQTATGAIESVGDGWYRCSIFPASSTNAGYGIVTPNDGGTPDTSNFFLTTYAGDGAKGVLVWGAQLETTALTGYLPNSTGGDLSGLTTVTRGVNGTTATLASSGDAIQQLPYALSAVNMPTRLRGISVSSDGTGAGRFTLCDKIGTTLCDIDIPNAKIYDLSFGGGIIFPNGIYVSNSDNITGYTLYTDKHSGAGLT